MSEITKREKIYPSKILIWIPAAFCAMLSIPQPFFPDGIGDAAFYCFLPMCFFFVGAFQHSLLKRIEVLEAEKRED